MKGYIELDTMAWLLIVLVIAIAFIAAWLWDKTKW
jgi:predicted Co/Zn/Cd cation transporter (cation efflux family)